MGKKKVDSNLSINQLREISTWISSVQDVDQVLELIIETATKMMNAKASSLLLLDPKSKHLYFKVATGDKKEDLKKFEVPLGHGHVVFVLVGLLVRVGVEIECPDPGVLGHVHGDIQSLNAEVGAKFEEGLSLHELG